MVDHGGTYAHGATRDGNHSSPADNHQPGCCGIFCLSVLAADDRQTVAPVEVGAVHIAATETVVFRRAPDRPDRPPISFSSSELR
jgi:hypothetical protein